MPEKVPLPLDQIPHECPVHKGVHCYREVVRTEDRVEYECGCYYVAGHKGGEEYLFGQVVYLGEASD